MQECEEMRLCLFQPDIPQNTGAAIRLCAGFGLALDIIEPCGFPLDDARLKRVAMDYDAKIEIKRHISWEAFLESLSPSGRGKSEAQGEGEIYKPRLILLTTKASQPYHQFIYQPDDILIVGRESSGVPDFVHETVDARVIIPIHTRSFNVIVAAGIVLAEGLRQNDLIGAPK
jgi:tRNA (cytidine/uridine-2'-O-)-methyltransferase